MKKIISAICIVCTILLMSTNVYAVERELNTSYTYLGNDIYLETIVEENISLFSTQTKSGSKTLNFKNSGNILFSIKVSGHVFQTIKQKVYFLDNSKEMSEDIVLRDSKISYHDMEL